MDKTANAPEVALLAGVTPTVQVKLEKLGIRSPFDLLLHLPLRYLDETRLCPIRDARPGKTVQLEGTIVSASVKYRPRKMLMCEVADGSGRLTLRFFHFHGSQVKTLSPGIRLRLFGEVRPGFLGPEMVHPHCRPVHDGEPLAETLTPVYPTTAGLSQATLRKLIAQAFAQCALDETLPALLLAPLQFPSLNDSLRYLHYPPPDASLAALEMRTHGTWQRLKFDELLAQQLSMRHHYQQRRILDAPPLTHRGELTGRLLAALPFRLTTAQQRVWTEISADIARSHPMQRLLQGDVGSGKTVVAALAALQAIENDYQAAIMAPTEILAEQHYRKLSAWLAPLGIAVAWLASSLGRKDKQTALNAIAAGDAALVVGTHALFQAQVVFSALGLVIIDEQHRFGVHQRLALRQKGAWPHQLMMGATPIPRTLSMSYYADLDVSVIDELPPGRTPVVTKLAADNRREAVVERVREACHRGRQAYWVCPLIEESEALQLKTALETFETLNQTLSGLRVGLVHGRLPVGEKNQIMTQFARGDIQLLVATTVIEVGVDVPNASLMVIEHAERMGLSQLHQLRGRVGRGVEASVCILLFQSPLSAVARTRLRVIYENNDGFEIARRDLDMRGPGEFLGAKQSGVPMLRVADVVRDHNLLNSARHAADVLLRDNPRVAIRHLQRWFGERQDWLEV